MNQETREKIKRLMPLLTDEQKARDIIEITEEDHNKVYKFLESKGNLNIDYSISPSDLGSPSEREGAVNLWRKKLNGRWTVNLYHINRMINAKWIKE